MRIDTYRAKGFPSTSGVRVSVTGDQDDRAKEGRHAGSLRQRLLAFPRTIEVGIHLNMGNVLHKP